MPTAPILILGGTRDARELAAALDAAGHRVITSLAGVTQEPVLPQGEVRRGGFGGVDGLRQFLTAEKVALVIDATHPFAARISAHAAAACQSEGVPLLRFERPGWTAQEGDHWTSAQSVEEAASLLPPAARVLLTIGRKEVAPFFARQGLSGVARMIEAPPVEPPPGWLILQHRPHFTAEGEFGLMRRHGITHLVTKNSGGTLTEGKLQAARRLGLPVIMIARPAKPEVQIFAIRTDLLEAVERVLSP